MSFYAFQVTINLLGFFLLIFILWIVPGYWFLERVSQLSKLTRLFLATAIGFSAFSAVVFFTRLFGLPFWIGIFPFFLIGIKSALTLFKRVRKEIAFTKWSSSQKYFALITILVVLVQSLVLLGSGLKTKEGMQFSLSFHDSIWHIYLIDELAKNFPPRHPGFSPQLVENYHFLTDLSLAAIKKVLPLSTFDIYYRSFPIFVSAFFSLGLFVFTRDLTASEKKANLAVLFTVFSGNMAWVMGLFRGDDFQVNSSSFMLDAITFMLLNPHAVLVFPLLLAGLLALSKVIEGKGKIWIMLAALPFSVLVGIKAWGGSLILGALAITAILSSIGKKNYRIWAVWLITLGLSLGISLPLVNPREAAGLVWIPGWLLKRMVEDPNRLNLPVYALREEYFRQAGDIFGLLRINLEELVLYFFGNLWLRVLGLGVLLHRLFKKKDNLSLLLTALVAASLSLPVLFNQGRMAYDIVQFAPYAMMILSIFTAIALSRFAEKFPRAVQLPLLILVLVAASASNLNHLKEWINDPLIVIPKYELEAYEYLGSQTPEDSIVMLYPDSKIISTVKVAALARRQTFYADRTLSVMTGEDYELREKRLSEFFSGELEEQKRFLAENNIDYILVSKEASFGQSRLGLEKVFSNFGWVVYKIRD